MYKLRGFAVCPPEAPPMKNAYPCISNKRVWLVLRAVLFALVLFTGFVSCTRHAPASAYATVPQTAYDFSQLDAGNQATHDFYIKNTGGAPLLIEGIMSSCRCIFARVANRRIEPGSNAVLSVRLDTKGLSGPVDQRIIVYTNAANERTLTFKITAYVKQLYSLQPDTVDFGDIHTNTPLSQTVVFTSTSMGIASVTPLTPYVKASVKTRGQDEYDLLIKLEKGLPAGLLQSAVLISTTSASVPVLRVKVTANKIFDLRANPDKIFAGILLKDRKSSVFSTYIFSKHKRPFTIKMVIDTGNYLDIHAERLAPDIYKLGISAKPFEYAGEYTSDIIVSTTDKQTPVLQIPFRILVMDR